MDIIILSTLLILFVNYGSGVELAMNSTADETNTIYLEEGSELAISCSVKEEIMYIISNPVEWKHELVWNNQTKTTNIGENSNSENINLWKLDLIPPKTTGAWIRFDLTIKQVTREEDGMYTCTLVVDKLTGETISHSVNVVVYQPVSLSFKFADKLLTQSGDSIKMDAGAKAMLTCHAEGSNPGVDELKVYRDSVELTDLSPSDPKPIAMATEFRQYETSVGGEMTILKDYNNQELACIATGPNNAVTTVSFNLEVITYDPEIVCTEAEGYPQKMFMSVECKVNATGIQVVDSFFRLADQGKNLNVGEINYEGVNYKIERSEKNSMIDLKMTIEKAEKWHFEERLVIVVESAGNHETSYRLKMTSLEATTQTSEIVDNNGTGKLSNPLTAMLFTCILSVWSRL